MQASVPDEPGWSADVALRAIASGDAKRPLATRIARRSSRQEMKGVVGGAIKAAENVAE
jgi:hypothetical protein